MNTNEKTVLKLAAAALAACMAFASCDKEHETGQALEIEHEPAALPPKWNCESPADCGDANACTIDYCVWGTCRHSSIDGCVPCSAAAQCDDGSPCSADLCTNGVCSHLTTGEKLPCGNGGFCRRGQCCEGYWDVYTDPPAEFCADDCDDGDACTPDLVLDYDTCVHVESSCPRPDVCACTSDEDCSDGDPCTQSTCLNGVCYHTNAVAGTPCSTEAVPSGRCSPCDCVVP